MDQSATKAQSISVLFDIAKFDGSDEKMQQNSRDLIRNSILF